MAIKFTQVVDVANQRITSLGSPSVATDATNKQYVDNIAQGLNWKLAARAASTGDVDLTTPGATVDGVTLALGDRVLLKDQTDPVQNGIYAFDTGTTALVRSTDADTSLKVQPGMALSVTEGTVNADKTYVLVSDGPIVLDTDPLIFSLLNGGSGAAYTAGNGLSLTGGEFALNPVVGGGVLATASGASVDPVVVVRKFAANVGDGATNPITVTHGLNTLDVTVEVYETASGDTVFCEVNRPAVNDIVLGFGTAPAAAVYRVVVHG